ncbi:MAG: aldose 1-epimerase [Actinomycetaceae bacterium]|nr:aldose 1-epimerase [Arcanobacterium sp.]MDD7687293.1 aldose 1-epimerase [Actinomycetaceae bacterium]MDY5273571.1 aldose 1-epimerase [Arcanobacterium sp.]
MAAVAAARVIRETFDGMPAWRIESESGSTALIAERGASVLSWEPKPGVNVIDGYVNAEELREASWSRSLVAVPWPGRMKGNKYRFDGVTYELPTTSRGSALHGFVYDEDFEVEDASSSLTLRCDFPGAQGYPWPFTVRVTYSLEVGADSEEHLSVMIAATNTGTTDIPLAIGWHPYVKLPDNATISNYAVTIPARTKILYGPDSVPLAGEAAYSGVNAPVTINYLGARAMDDSYRGLIPDENGVVNTVVSDSASNATIRLSQEPADAPVVHIYTGDGAPRDPRGSLALEPLSHLPDAFNRADSAASIRLAPQETRQLTATITCIL